MFCQKNNLNSLLSKEIRNYYVYQTNRLAFNMFLKFFKMIKIQLLNYNQYNNTDFIISITPIYGYTITDVEKEKNYPF